MIYGNRLDINSLQNHFWCCSRNIELARALCGSEMSEPNCSRITLAFSLALYGRAELGQIQA
jgi:hypothetical protein